MTFVAVAGGTAFIAAVVAGLLYLPVRRSVRRSRAETDVITARMEAEAGKTPPLPPFVPLPIPDGPPPEADLRITIDRHPEADMAALPKLAAELIREASRLDQVFGGTGLSFDRDGSEEEPTKLVLRLVPNRPGWGARGRLRGVAEEMSRRMREAREAVTRQQADSIRSKIERELGPPLPPDVIRDVEVAVGPVIQEPAAVRESLAVTH